MKRYALLRPRIYAAQAIAGAQSYGRVGSLEVRLARSWNEIKAAQKLRYSIFYEEMQAKPDWTCRLTRRDIDAYDAIADHLLVIDHDLPKSKRIVGTYRLLRQEVAERHKGFYSASEFDLSTLMSDEFRQNLGGGRQLLELGRSCVHPDYRASSTINMLWKGIAEYLKEHRIAWMFGCASFEGTDAETFREAFAYLHHNHLVPDDFAVKALDDRYVPMNLMASDEIDARRARRALPPLIKGYLRLGCLIGDGAVIDHQFGTTDVFILLPVEKIADRYSRHYDLAAEANDGQDTAAA
ncbi:GNAT family N-acetyltransferase [Gimibacter soli]|uniref:L-ornithine N(alpha)-acyltransferase n=1 Tax=Gimibacter soli TaxID=3024400 RepID=A0AAE9XR05_9PROT|nr:GNAT family N-acyltransferase [Gimibacter soli]WCL54649.1 GNAT family N-acetyltransferase [Gimibacter soli]